MIINYLSTEKLAVATTASANAVLSVTRPTMVAIIGDTAFHLLVAPAASSPDATTDNHFIAANEEKIISLSPGDEISVRGAGTGSVWVSPVTVVSK